MNQAEPLAPTERARPQTECAKCKRSTRVIAVDVERFGVTFFNLLILGPWALFAPSDRKRMLQCEHCGKHFIPRPPPMKRKDKLIGLAFAAFCLTLLVIAAALGMMMLKTYEV